MLGYRELSNSYTFSHSFVITCICLFSSHLTLSETEKSSVQLKIVHCNNEKKSGHVVPKLIMLLFILSLFKPL